MRMKNGFIEYTTIGRSIMHGHALSADLFKQKREPLVKGQDLSAGVALTAEDKRMKLC